MRKPKLFLLCAVTIFSAAIQDSYSQWTTSGSNIYNSNSGNVGIGNNAPLSLLYVGKNMTEPTITVRNLGGAGGASFRMWDNASGADWKFKATNTGGFKIRDNAYGLDVITIESNSAANVLYINSAGSIGIGTASPAASAAVDISSNDKGFLMPRMTLSQIQAIPVPADGLQVYCSTDDKIYVFVSSVNQWKELAYGAGTISLPSTCGTSFQANHVAGNVAPWTTTITYGTVTNIPGEPSKCWISQNLGASSQASNVGSTNDDPAGWYWQFNRAQGYSIVSQTQVRTPNTAWINNITENSNWTPGNDPCALLLPAGWRLPTESEWSNVSFNWINWNDAFYSDLKMHAAGGLASVNGILDARGSDGWYWSSIQYDNSSGRKLSFNSSTSVISSDLKANGLPVRCIKN